MLCNHSFMERPYNLQSAWTSSACALLAMRPLLAYFPLYNETINLLFRTYLLWFIYCVRMWYTSICSAGCAASRSQLIEAIGCSRRPTRTCYGRSTHIIWLAMVYISFMLYQQYYRCYDLLLGLCAPSNADTKQSIFNCDSRVIEFKTFNRKLLILS